MDLTQAGLEPSREAMQELVRQAGERVVEYLSTLEMQRASDLSDAAEVARLVVEPLPNEGTKYDELLELVFRRLAPKVCNTNSPGMFSYVNGGAMLHSAVADMITAATNPYVGYWGAAPGLAELERTVIGWFSQLFGLPAGAGGVLLSGGSLANLSALVTAREARLGDDFRAGTLYASDQVHHSVAKAARIAGFPADALRVVPSDTNFRLDVGALEHMVAEDAARGRKPFFLVASAGTTNTGAVDDLPRLAGVARARKLWFHVDAAYGGCFALTDRGKRALTGIEHADTIVVDPHKSLFVPFGTGCLLARDVELLHRAHCLHSEYIDGVVEQGEGAKSRDFADLSPELSRGMRGLRIWLPLKLLGAQAFRRALDEKLDLARRASALIGELLGYELVAPPELSILAFRAVEPGLSPEGHDRLNAEILERVNARGRVHLSGTELRGRFTLRVCVLSLRSHLRDVEACVEELRACRSTPPNPR